MVQMENGTKRLVDLSELHDDLSLSCTRQGLTDPDLPSDVISVVSTFVDRHGEVDAEKMDRLVVRILMDSGLHALAETFATVREIAPEFILDEVIDPSSTTIEAILKSEPFFLTKPTDRLTSIVLSHLKNLSFATCGRNLIVELARNVWSNLNDAKETPKDAYWLMSRSEIRDVIDGIPFTFVTSGIMEIKSISSLLPILHVCVSMLPLARQCGAGNLAELSFYPALDELCHCLPSIKTQLIPELKKRRIGMSVDDLSMDVTFKNVDDLQKEFLMIGTAGTSLKKELDAVVSATLEPRSISWEFV